MLLGSVNSLALDRGSLLWNAAKNYQDNGFCAFYNNLYTAVKESADYQKPYSSPEFLSKN